MGAKTVAFMLCACVTVVAGNTQPPQRFQARKFLDMLGQTFDPQVAYLDLLTALHERLNLDPINNVNTSSSAADSGITNPNAMAETATNCPAAPAERGASITYTSDTHVLGSRAFYQCEVGYEGKSVFIQCLQGGKWSQYRGWTGCTPVDCGVPPTVANADFSQTATTYNSVVMYTCQPGYKMDKANANVTCSERGTWSTPTFTCEKIATGAQSSMPFGSLFNGGGGNTAATNQNPMMSALLQNMPGMQGMPGFNMPGLNQGSAPSNNNNNNNPMMAMFSQMFPNMAQPATPPPPTTPKPAPNNPAMPSGFQLPSHLQSLLPNGISNTAGIKPQDLMTLTSLGLGSGTTAGAPRDITQLLGSMNPMSIFGGAMGMPSPGQAGAMGAAGGAPGAPPDPEKMAEQREEMMMRAAMASAMRSMMGNKQGQQANSTSSQNPAMEMMTLMALQSGLSGAAGGGGGSASGGMDPLAMMFGGMNPSMLLGGGGGGGAGGAGLFGNLFGGA